MECDHNLNLKLSTAANFPKRKEWTGSVRGEGQYIDKLKMQPYNCLYCSVGE